MRAGVSEEELALGGRHDAAAGALEQLPIDQALEPAHLHAQGRLRAAGLRRHPAQAALPADRHIGAQQVDADLV